LETRGEAALHYAHKKLAVQARLQPVLASGSMELASSLTHEKKLETTLSTSTLEQASFIQQPPSVAR
jgi:hypothetical protein